MLKLDKMLLIGSERQKVGKTTLACGLISKFSKNYSVAAIKITTLSKEYPNHPIAPDSDHWKKGYCLIEEINSKNKTDTSKFLAAGAQQSFWLRVFDDSLLEGFTAVLNQITKGAVIICESTSLIKFVKPAIFIMITSDSVLSGKKHARDLRQYASIKIPSDNMDIESIVMRIGFKAGHYNL